jgi:hypothetical protein
MPPEFFGPATEILISPNEIFKLNRHMSSVA